MSDYDRIAAAISFIADRVDRQPTLEEIASHLHLSPYHFQRLFSRWAGITPKRFLQAQTLAQAKHLMRESIPLLAVADTLGLSSSSRLHDHFVHLDAMTPGEYRQGGAGLIIHYAVHDTPFGDALIATTARGVCHLGFIDRPHHSQGHQTLLADLAQQWPRADFQENPEKTAPVIQAMFSGVVEPNRPLSLSVVGTNFQIRVWQALLQIPLGRVTSYAQVAASIGQPTAARAVGRAVGANPIGFLIPCHRVIQQSGHLGGYHWGETRKQAILTWEAAQQTSFHP